MTKPDEKPTGGKPPVPPGKPADPGKPDHPQGGPPGQDKPKPNQDLPEPEQPEEAVPLQEKAPKRPINPATGKKYKKGEVPLGWNRPCE